MQITWIGHSCFCLEEDGYRLVIDPYTDVPGYPALRVQAHNVLCTHAHFDHSHIGGVILLPPVSSPFAIRTMETYHDETQGSQRGTNTVQIVTAGGVTVVHLGDLGHRLSPEQVEEIGAVDVLLIPVGGTYTLDAAQAFAEAQAIAPRMIVPMHYRHGAYGLREVSEAEDFLGRFAAAEVTRLTGDSFTTHSGDGKSGVFVPQYPA